MARTPIWKTIQDTLTTQIADGEYAPGAKLPTEAKLAARFGVNRHTVRRALAEMSDLGQLYSRRGAGVFVTQKTTEYPIGRRVRFHQNLRLAEKAPLLHSIGLNVDRKGNPVEWGHTWFAGERVTLTLADL